MEFKDTKYGDLTNKNYDDSISLSYSKLTSLKGSPKIVKNYFDISWNYLQDLKYCPQICEVSFNCSCNNLTSLKYSPKEVLTNFVCKFNNLKSLKGSPKEILGDFNCEGNEELENVIQQIIENQIKAYIYYTDEGKFSFESIQEEFEKYGKLLLNKMKNINKQKMNNQKIDYGLGIF